MKLFRVLILLSIILIAFGCDDKSPTNNDPEPGEVVLSDDTVILDETQVNEDLQAVSPDGNTFTFNNTSTTDDIEEGDILVSGITDLIPSGFLKKVTNVQDNGTTITVSTENAALDEALQQGDLDASYTFEPSNIMSSFHVDGVELISNSREDLFSLTINMIFYDADGNTNTTDDQITMVGTLEFTAEMLMNLSVSNWQLNQFDIQLVNTFERDLTFNNTIEYNFQDEVTIAAYNFPVIYFSIGIFPVTIQPTIEVSAYVDASLQAGVSFGVTATETMSTGAQYLNGNWSPISTYSKTLEYNGPTGYGSIEAQAGLKPQLQTLLYGIAGPYIVLDAYGKFDCELEVSFDDLLISEEILFGLNLDAGLLMEVMSHTVFNYYMDIYDEEWILHQYEYTIGQAPVATIISPSNGAQFDLGDNVHLEGSATDVQDGQLTGNDLEWFSNIDGSLGFGEDLYISSLSQGPHSITLIATDSDDYTGEDEVSINILGAGNNPPSIPFDPSPDDEATNISINTDLSWDCTDPDPDDILTYDVYFGTSPNPPLVSSEQSEKTFDLDLLSYSIDFETTYYWKIKAYDDHDNSTTGEVWEFTTMEEGDIPLDCISYYPFNGNANDESGNGYNGTPSGTVNFNENDRFNNNNSAVGFVGDDSFINCGEDPVLPESDLTFSLWIKPNEITSNNRYIISTGGQTGSSMGYFLLCKTGGIEIGRTNTIHTCTTENDQPINPLEIDNWYHIIGRYNSNIGVLDVFVNGIFIESFESDGQATQSDHRDVYIANSNNVHSASRNFIGLIDDIRIYDRILTDTEIEALYHEGGWDE